MERVRKKVRTFVFVLLFGVIVICLLRHLLQTLGTRLDPEFHRVEDDFEGSTDMTQSPYAFMKNERETMIRRALENGEQLLIRGKLFKLYRPTFTCPYKVARLGSVRRNGAKWVCGAQELYSNLSRTCVVYSFGVDGDSSFEADILKYTNCDVYAYDHTVDKISKPLHPDNPRVKFGKYGLANFSSLGNASFKTVKDVMVMNGHDWIDILKLDVERSEFDGMTMLMDDFEELPIGQLLVELHLVDEKSKVYSRIVPWLNRLEEKGLRIFWTAPNARDSARTKIDCGTSAHLMIAYEYSFININAQPYRNSSFTFEKLLMGAAISTDLHYPLN